MAAAVAPGEACLKQKRRPEGLLLLLWSLRGGVFFSNSVFQLPSSEFDSQKARVFFSNSLSNSHFELEIAILALTSGPS